jgi:hypothetical protein
MLWDVAQAGAQAGAQGEPEQACAMAGALCVTRGQAENSRPELHKPLLYHGQNVPLPAQWQWGCQCLAPGLAPAVAQAAAQVQPARRFLAQGAAQGSPARRECLRK